MASYTKRVGAPLVSSARRGCHGLGLWNHGGVLLPGLNRVSYIVTMHKLWAQEKRATQAAREAVCSLLCVGIGTVPSMGNCKWVRESLIQSYDQRLRLGEGHRGVVNAL